VNEKGGHIPAVTKRGDAGRPTKKAQKPIHRSETGIWEKKVSKSIAKKGKKRDTSLKENVFRFTGGGIYGPDKRGSARGKRVGGEQVDQDGKGKLQPEEKFSGGRGFCPQKFP